jgi:hypothetical protein
LETSSRSGAPRDRIPAPFYGAHRAAVPDPPFTGGPARPRPPKLEGFTRWRFVLIRDRRRRLTSVPHRDRPQPRSTGLPAQGYQARRSRRVARVPVRCNRGDLLAGASYSSASARDDAPVRGTARPNSSPVPRGLPRSGVGPPFTAGRGWSRVPLSAHPGPPSRLAAPSDRPQPRERGWKTAEGQERDSAHEGPPRSPPMAAAGTWRRPTPSCYGIRIFLPQHWRSAQVLCATPVRRPRPMPDNEFRN